MSRAMYLKLAPLGLATLFALGWSEPAPVGPPWISLELPANPLDPTTRGAALVIHAFHHQRPAGFPIAGKAEGLVNGARKTVELEFSETSRDGVYALRQQWPAEGHWVLAITTGARGDVSLVAELGPDGGVRQDEYFQMPVKLIAVRSVRVVQGSVDDERIETALQAMAMRSE